jgi:ribosomal protein S18 acetylase RimI-like enzyme
MTDDRQLAVRVMELRDVPGAAALLADALYDDPAYRFLMPDVATRSAGLVAFFAGNLETHLPHACSYVLSEADSVIGTVTVRPPQGVPISVLTMIRHGLLPFARRHGLSAVRRLLLLKEVYDGLEHDVARGASHFHVHMMAIASDRQGRGLGSRLLAEVFRRSVDAPGGRASPTVLTTHREQNVTFYGRLGFTVSDSRELTLTPASSPFRVWSMFRPPVDSGALPR